MTLNLNRGLKNEVLCTRNPTSGVDSCRSYFDYTSTELEAIERQNIPHWMEYNYYPDFVVYW